MLPVVLGHYSLVCIELLKTYFGEVVKQVGSYLIRRGHRPLFEIPNATNLSIKEVWDTDFWSSCKAWSYEIWQVKKALAVLIQHNLVKFEASERNNNIAEYSIIPHNVYCLLRYPKYDN